MSDTLIAGSQATPTNGHQSADGAGQGQQQSQQTNALSGSQQQGQQQQSQSSATTQSQVGNTNQGAQDAASQQQVAYDLKLPDGSILDSAYLDQTKSLAKEMNLTPEAAQKLVERDNYLQQQQLTKWNEQVVQWEGVVKSDKEIGGDNFQASVNDARTALDKFGSPEFKAMLNQSGYGNHPELVRLLSRVGKAMREDSMMNGSSSGSSRQEKSMVDIFYPGMSANQSE